MSDDIIKPFGFGFLGLLFFAFLWRVLQPSTGGFHESCNRDGGCDNGLVCDTSIGIVWCENPEERPKRQARQERAKLEASSEEYHGYYESEKFCINCKNMCKDTGMAECQFVDTSTWGNKAPASCKCK